MPRTLDSMATNRSFAPADSTARHTLTVHGGVLPCIWGPEEIAIMPSSPSITLPDITHPDKPRDIKPLKCIIEYLVIAKNRNTSFGLRHSNSWFTSSDLKESFSWSGFVSTFASINLGYDHWAIWTIGAIGVTQSSNISTLPNMVFPAMLLACLLDCDIKSGDYCRRSFAWGKCIRERARMNQERRELQQLAEPRH